MSTSNDPLWVLVAMAYDSEVNTRSAAAAVLRVIADEVVPEQPFSDIAKCDIAENLMWCQRMCTRQGLLAEAERAEAGQ